jgi:succinate dehydrogenase/fumarate reductase-like Fe-S protein
MTNSPTNSRSLANSTAALDALIKINDQMAPALSFRRSTDRYLGYSILLQSQRWLADSRDQRTAEGES